MRELMFKPDYNSKTSSCISKGNNIKRVITYRDFANNTENDPTAPETIAYEKGSSIRQYLFSCPETASRFSPFLHIIHVDYKKDILYE